MKFFKSRGLYLFAVILSLAIMLSAGCARPPQVSETAGKSAAPQAEARNITIKMLDIGQGDAALIRAGDQIVMIDTGDVDTRDQLVGILKKEGIKTIDKLIISHPHADHLGGAYAVLNHFTVRNVYDNGQTAATNTYRTYLKLIKKRNIPYKQLLAGDQLDLGGGAKFIVLSPRAADIKGSEDLNNNSIVGKVVFGEFSMLFTGDSEAPTEKEMLKAHKGQLKSTILKSPHHGSKTSSNRAYLKAVAPEAAFISVGADNEYKHPHAVTINKYNDMKIKIYRTDQDGAITVKSDGKTYDITKEKSNAKRGD